MSPEPRSGRLSPAVELLWEDGDPYLALRDRFGFAGPATAVRWLRTTLEAHWHLAVRSCSRIVISDCNALAWLTTAEDDAVLAKWSSAPARFERLSRVAALTHWLGDRGLPVSTPIATTAGTLQLEVDGVSMSLQRVVAGELLDVTDSEAVVAAGRTLARLHLALAAHPDPDRVVTPEPRPGELRARVTDWLATAGDRIPVAALQTTRGLLPPASTDPLPLQLVHGDFRSSNVLCAYSDVVAAIDFEECRVDHRVVEVARSAVMLGTRFRDWGPVPAGIRARFLRGYVSVAPLTAAESDWWRVLVAWHALSLVPPGDDPTGWLRSALEHLAAVGGA